MNQRIVLIRQHRKLLQLRSQYQRLQLSEDAGPCYKTLRVADSVLNGVIYLRDHPLMIGMLTFLLVFKPKGKAGMWVGRLFSLWEVFQTVKSATRRAP